MKVQEYKQQEGTRSSRNRTATISDKLLKLICMVIGF